MRLFGARPQHASRLEMHGELANGFVGPGWTITIQSKTFLGLSCFQFRDSGAPYGDFLLTEKQDAKIPPKSRCLAYHGNFLWVDDPSGNNMDAAWYLVPAIPFGWSVFHASTGWRLDVESLEGSNIILSPNISGMTHWDQTLYDFCIEIHCVTTIYLVPRHPNVPTDLSFGFRIFLQVVLERGMNTLPLGKCFLWWVI